MFLTGLYTIAMIWAPMKVAMFMLQRLTSRPSMNELLNRHAIRLESLRSVLDIVALIREVLVNEAA